VKKYYFLLMIAFGLSLQASDGTEFDRYQEQVTRYYASVALQAHLHQYVYSEINKRLDDGVEQSGCNMNSDMEQQYGDNIDCKSIEQLLADITKDQSRVTCDQKVIQNQLAAIYNQYEFLQKNTPWDLDQYMQSSYQLHNNLSSCLEVTHDRQLLLNYWKKRLIEQQQASSAILLDSQADVPLQELDSQSTELDQVAKKKKKKKKNQDVLIVKEPLIQDVLQQQADQAKELQRQKDLKRNAQLKAVQMQKEAEKKAADDQRRSIQRKDAMLHAMKEKEVKEHQSKKLAEKKAEEDLLLRAAQEEVLKYKIPKETVIVQSITLEKMVENNVDQLLIALRIPDKKFEATDDELDHLSMNVANAFVPFENILREHQEKLVTLSIMDNVRKKYEHELCVSHDTWSNLLKYMQAELHSEKVLLTIRSRNQAGIHDHIEISSDEQYDSLQDNRVACGYLAIKVGKVKQVLQLIELVQSRIHKNFVVSKQLEKIDTPKIIGQRLHEKTRLMANALRVGENKIEQHSLLTRIMLTDTSKIWHDHNESILQTLEFIKWVEMQYDMCKGQHSDLFSIQQSIDDRHDSMNESLACQYQGLTCNQIALLSDLQMVFIDVMLHEQYKA